MQERGITLPIDVSAKPTTDDEVFYNPAMERNRDISTACLAVLHDRFGDGWSVCDALAASGIRGLRYLAAVDGLEEVVLNDIRREAVAAMEAAVDRNDIDDARLSIHHGDANAVLTERFRSLDFVDIDPFGSPAPYLDSAARALRHNTAAGFTATDLGPLYGSYPEVCRRRYAASPVKAVFGHETGLRILIKEVFQAFARYDYAFTPLLSWHEQHYSRVIGRVEESKQECNRMLDSIGTLSFCRECRWRAYTATGECPCCGSPTDQAGPLWTGEFADEGFADEAAGWLAAEGYSEAESLVRRIRDEAGIPTPFYDTHELASTLGIQAPAQERLLGALRDDGYTAVPTHFAPHGIRTGAPLDAVQDAIRTG
ncbi:MAG: tRNA (guanine(10)-N(2))-dimethyltransferase [Candidatus Nanohaloarchaea archaeon]|nr:tRNA (guanine(10)-N(2))-dimethyltransferase [Candidatus Nanohaloarchaea archaeon]